jgi:hypothetical protein
MKVANLTLQKAVELGEYQPEYLSNFSEWKKFSRHTQFQFIKTAIENRRKLLLQQWADISTILDFSKKPELSEALKNIEKQLRQVEDDREELLIEYSK